jgi:hypothetical protein
LHLLDTLVTLKDNYYIEHLSNDEYINSSFSNTKDITNEIPLILLLGGSSYKMYSKLFNEFYKETILDINDCLIDSLDYDVSIVMKNNFNKNSFKDILTQIETCVVKLTNIIEISDKFEIISKNDIKKDKFLEKKTIFNKNYTKLLKSISFSGSDYYSYILSFKYKGSMYQIVEILFWKNGIISNNISLQSLKYNKCILYQNNTLKILLPNILLLIKSNIISMQSRFYGNNYNKCIKDFYRLKYLENISKLPKLTDFNYINVILANIDVIYKKENPYLFNLPFSICSLHISDENKKIIHQVYNKFINIDLKKQIEIMTNNVDLNNDEKNNIKNILDSTNLNYTQIHDEE